jgi:diguanylate cyclase (GGDEF)-like protein/PAS domain S-box-containing protein
MPDNSKELLHVFIDQAPVAIAMFDREMQYIAASRRWLSDYGLSEMQVRGLSHYDVFPDIPERWREIHRRAFAGEIISADDDRFDRADGSVQWLRWEVRPWFGKDGLGGITIFFEDVTERHRVQSRLEQLNRELETRVSERTSLLESSVHDLKTALLDAEKLRKELREQAIRDPLTGLYNRRYLEETLAHEVARSVRAHSPLSLLMFDMDNFKQLNDVFGHAMGDAVLKGVGRFVAQHVRAQDVVCRFGGDEFIIVMPETPLEGANAKAGQLLTALQGLRQEMMEMQLPQVDFSMGVATLPENGESCVALLKSVDDALYRAKQQGGGRVIKAA